jgi:PAS domain S-box-containing protein
MGTPIKVLLVEDNEDAAFLLVHLLRTADYELTVERVDTPEAMRNALERDALDLIISDFSLPEFSGPAALAMCQEKGLDIPFIVVSGRIGEEVAVQMMKAGADDFVSKDNLSRLIPVVGRELRSHRERRGRTRAEAMMVHLASVVESCDDGIFSQTLEGTVLSWNSGAEWIFGYTAEEMIGQSLNRLQPPDRSAELEEISDKIKCGQRVLRYETLRLRKDGKPIEVALTVSPVKDGAGRVIGASVVARDISLRKEAERERSKLIEELTQALARVKTLGGLLPICASCKKIRNDNGYWEQVETYIKSRSNADFTHGICPDCMHHLYPNLIKTPPG